MSFKAGQIIYRAAYGFSSDKCSTNGGIEPVIVEDATPNQITVRSQGIGTKEFTGFRHRYTKKDFHKLFIDESSFYKQRFKDLKKIREQYLFQVKQTEDEMKKLLLDGYAND